MTGEIYKNGDIYYIKTLLGELGEIKMFDKDDNEINWIPTQNLGDKVIFYNQAYINEQLKRLEQENKELKSQRDEAVIAFNNLMLDIISDVPFTGEIGGERNISIKDHLHQMQKALALLEEIKEVLKFYADSWVDEKMYPNLHYDNTKAKEGLSRINEVLNDI